MEAELDYATSQVFLHSYSAHIVPRYQVLTIVAWGGGRDQTCSLVTSAQYLSLSIQSARSRRLYRCMTLV
jgi:hypothetical protein